MNSASFPAALLPADNQPSAQAMGSLLNVRRQASTTSSIDKGIKAAAQDFEAQFLTTMFAEAFKTVELKAPFNGGAGEDQFKDFLYQEYGKLMASKGGIGIADAVVAQQANAAYARTIALGK